MWWKLLSFSRFCLTKEKSVSFMETCWNSRKTFRSLNQASFWLSQGSSTECAMESKSSLKTSALQRSGWLRRQFRPSLITLRPMGSFIIGFMISWFLVKRKKFWEVMLGSWLWEVLRFKRKRSIFLRFVFRFRLLTGMVKLKDLECSLLHWPRKWIRRASEVLWVIISSNWSMCLRWVTVIRIESMDSWLQEENFGSRVTMWSKVTTSCPSKPRRLLLQMVGLNQVTLFRSFLVQTSWNWLIERRTFLSCLRASTLLLRNSKQFTKDPID